MQTMHAVDPDKVSKLAQSMRRDGWQGRPLLAITLGNESMLITGTHRYAAAEEAGIDPVIYYIDAADYDGELTTELVEARDDDERIIPLEDMDPEAAALMAAEIESNLLGE